jgi:hypothetical protein
MTTVLISAAAPAGHSGGGGGGGGGLDLLYLSGLALAAALKLVRGAWGAARRATG